MPPSVSLRFSANPAKTLYYCIIYNDLDNKCCQNTDYKRNNSATLFYCEHVRAVINNSVQVVGTKKKTFSYLLTLS